MQLCHLAIATLALVLLAGPVHAWDDDTASPDSLRGHSSSLDSVDTGESEDLDDADTGHSNELDDVDTGHSDEVGAAETGRAAELDDVDTGHSAELDDVDTGHSGTIEDTRRPWQPPACDGSLPAGTTVPEGSNMGAWTASLNEARNALDKSEHSWRQAETGAAVPNYDTRNPTIHQIERDRFIQAARDEYSQARCALASLIDLAHRAGVPPGVLRPYRLEVPAGRQP